MPVNGAGRWGIKQVSKQDSEPGKTRQYEASKDRAVLIERGVDWLERPAQGGPVESCRLKGAGALRKQQRRSRTQDTKSSLDTLGQGYLESYSIGDRSFNSIVSPDGHLPCEEAEREISSPFQRRKLTSKMFDDWPRVSEHFTCRALAPCL